MSWFSIVRQKSHIKSRMLNLDSKKNTILKWRDCATPAEPSSSEPHLSHKFINYSCTTSLEINSSVAAKPNISQNFLIFTKFKKLVEWKISPTFTFQKKKNIESCVLQSPWRLCFTKEIVLDQSVFALKVSFFCCLVTKWIF